MTGKIKLLPIVIILCSVGLAFKINSLAIGVNSLVQPVKAQEQEGLGAGEAANTPAGTSPAAQTNTTSSAPPRNTTDPLMMSRAELDLLQDLVNRREELNNRESQISVREHLLETTEQRIDGKISKLQNLEARISALVKTYETNENEQLTSLVKVYETMKPKDAAKIFETLDMTIQLEVATRMKESKMALIMSNMSIKKAEQLTSELASRATLPDIDG